MKNTIKIAITYEKGGCGKTTTAVNLSSILGERGYKVLLVDLDFQAYATSYFDLCNAEQYSINEIMNGICSAQDAIIDTGFENLYLLPSKYQFKGIETVLMMKTRRQEYTLSTALNTVEDDYDFIILDCPPNGERIKENALVYADYIILPAIPDDYAMHGLLCIYQEVTELKKFVKPNIEILGILITMYERNNNKQAYTEYLQNQEDIPCFKTIIRKNTTLSEAINHSRPINYYRRSSNGNMDYNRLCDEVLSMLGGKLI